MALALIGLRINASTPWLIRSTTTPLGMRCRKGLASGATLEPILIGVPSAKVGVPTSATVAAAPLAHINSRRFTIDLLGYCLCCMGQRQRFLGTEVGLAKEPI